MKRKKDNYFAEREEKAVIDYILSESVTKKHKIYNEILREPFDKMVSSILRKYNNHIGNYDILNVEADGLSHLVENMIKFRPYIIEYRDIGDEEAKWIRHKNFKFLYEEDMIQKFEELSSNETRGYEYRILYASAYSYCGTIVRNFFRDHSKNSRKEIIKNINIDSSGINFDEDEIYSYHEDYTEEDDPVLLVFESIIGELDHIIKTNPKLNKNELIVGGAVSEILKNWEVLFTEKTIIGEYDKNVSNNFTKSKIFLLLKEYTRMDNKEIRLSMKPFKNVYLVLKDKFKLV